MYDAEANRDVPFGRFAAPRRGFSFIPLDAPFQHASAAVPSLLQQAKGAQLTTRPCVNISLVIGDDDMSGMCRRALMGAKEKA